MLQLKLLKKPALSTAVETAWRAAGFNRSEEAASELDCPFANHMHQQNEINALAASVRSEQAVYKKLHTVLEGMQQPLAPLFVVKDTLTKHSTEFPTMVNGDIVTYLANAWSVDGTGLFHSSTSKNLEIALDYAFAQYLLPRIIEPLKQNPGLYVELGVFFQERYPYTYLQLDWV